MSALAGKRILVVEDEYLIAVMIEDALTERGAVVVGPVYKILDGILLANQEMIDAAILDVNINGEPSNPIAEALAARNIPFIFATGYGETGLDGFGAAVLDKPYTGEKLAAALQRALRA
jgi:DNA-binding response OmpR family regulator